MNLLFFILSTFNNPVVKTLGSISDSPIYNHSFNHSTKTIKLSKEFLADYFIIKHPQKLVLSTNKILLSLGQLQ